MVEKSTKLFKKTLAFLKTMYYNLHCAFDEDTRYAPLAQLVEHLTLNQGVQGSSPWRCMKASFLTTWIVGDGVFFVPYELRLAKKTVK